MLGVDEYRRFALPFVRRHRRRRAAARRADHLLRQRRAASARGGGDGRRRRARHLLAHAARRGGRAASARTWRCRATSIRTCCSPTPPIVRQQADDAARPGGRPARPHHESRTRHPAGHADRQRRGARSRPCTTMPRPTRRAAVARWRHVRRDDRADHRPARAATTGRARATRRTRRRSSSTTAWTTRSYRDGSRARMRPRSSRSRSTCTCRSARPAAPTAAATSSSRSTATSQQRYLDYLDREIDLLASAPAEPARGLADALGRRHADVSRRRPNSRASFDRIARHFTFTPDAEIGIEIDPRVTSVEQLARLRELGFNRLSLGVQDFAPEVQAAVNRIQSYELTRDIIEAGRALGFASVNVDLIYGLPYQTLDGFRRTLDQVLTLAARSRGRVLVRVRAVDSRAHEAPARRVAAGAAPQARAARARRSTRSSARATGRSAWITSRCRTTNWRRRSTTRSLHRNFMGYTVQSARDMVALGVSGIGDVQGAFVQNAKKLSEYYAALDAGRFPVERGYALDARRRDPPARHHRTDVQRPPGHRARSNGVFGIVVPRVLRAPSWPN